MNNRWNLFSTATRPHSGSVNRRRWPQQELSVVGGGGASPLRLAAAASLILLLGCRLGSPPASDLQPATDPAPPTMTPATEAPAEAPLWADASSDTCQPPATEITAGSVIEESVDTSLPNSGRWYFCLQVPEGVKGLAFELTGLSANLNLFVAWPDLQTLQEGGLSFWSSSAQGAADELVIVEPGMVRGELMGFVQAAFVNPGPYYIEVSANTGIDSSQFTLTIEMER